jgi:branched-chain amino acid aminotransferase
LDLETFQGIFITGTSPKVLPVKKIDEICFSVEISMIREIMEYYEKLISGFCQSEK